MVLSLSSSSPPCVLVSPLAPQPHDGGGDDEDRDSTIPQTTSLPLTRKEKNKLGSCNDLKERKVMQKKRNTCVGVCCCVVSQQTTMMMMPLPFSPRPPRIKYLAPPFCGKPHRSSTWCIVCAQEKKEKIVLGFKQLNCQTQF